MAALLASLATKFHSGLAASSCTPALPLLSSRTKGGMPSVAAIAARLASLTRAARLQGLQGLQGLHGWHRC